MGLALLKSTDVYLYSYAKVKQPAHSIAPMVHVVYGATSVTVCPAIHDRTYNLAELLRADSTHANPTARAIRHVLYLSQDLSNVPSRHAGAEFCTCTCSLSLKSSSNR